MNLDKIGKYISLCCSIHCVLFPLVLVLLPFATMQEHAHLTIVGFSVLLAGWAFWRGVRQHGKKSLLILALFAIVCVLVGEAFLEARPWFHAVVSASAGFALAYGHHLNLKWCERKKCPCSEKHSVKY